MPTTKEQPLPAAAGQERPDERPVPSERRDELVRLAGELFAERGFAGTTIRHIADRAGILPGSLYHHFESKEAILDELLTGFWEKLMDRFERATQDAPSGSDALRGLLQAAVLIVRQYPIELAIVHKDADALQQLPSFAYLAGARSAAERPWIETLRRGVADGTFRADLDVELTHRVIWGGITGLIRWLSDGDDRDDRDVVAAVTDLVMPGLLP